MGGLISPVLDVIVKAHTHPYLSKAAVNNALELLVLMLKELPSAITPLGITDKELVYNVDLLTHRVSTLSYY